MLKVAKFRHPSERRAIHYLAGSGEVVVLHNLPLRYTEIDLVSYDPIKFHFRFIEVKSGSGTLLHPGCGIGPKRRRRMRMAVLEILSRIERGFYLGECGIGCQHTGCRFFQCEHNIPFGGLERCSISIDLLWLASGASPVLYEGFIDWSDASRPGY